jgi:plasmid stabilization system protein ParE
VDRHDIEFHRLAREEYLKARRWYAGHASAEVADRFRDEVDRALQKIVEQPNNWPFYYGKFRWVRLRRFPYLIVYHADDAGIMVVAVAHASRRPGYWRHRK